MDRSKLSEVVKLWYNLHSQSLVAGERTYKKLGRIIEALGDPTATTFTAKDFAHYRDKRLSGEIYFSEKWKNGAEPVTVNLEQSYLSGMFRELARLGEWNQPNPLENMRKFTVAEKEMAWLTHAQITELLAACRRGDSDLSLVVEVCLSTGARWREAENLTRSQIIPHKITFIRTKGKKNRSVPISKALHKKLITRGDSRLFSECYFRFMAALENTSIQLPKGQLTHVIGSVASNSFV
ncbi:Site-specific recombinase XerD [Serratia ficaria]|nr:Site-specific recombinase XerD [Serratia ficaria]